MDALRIQRLVQKLDLPCFIENRSDLLYLTGLDLSQGRLFVSDRETLLFVDGRYYNWAQKEAPCSVRHWDEWKKIGDRRVGFDSAEISCERFSALQKEAPHIDWVPRPRPVQKIRALKESAEIEALQKASRLTFLGYQHIANNLKEGISEEELAWEFEVFCRKEGAVGLSFDPIIAFGENSAYPHYRAGKRRLRKGDIVLIDVGAVVDQYRGDMTRVVHFGPPNPRLLQLEAWVAAAQKKAIEEIKPGILAGELDRTVRKIFQEAGVEALYTHSLGHGIGLETHEFPRIRIDGEDRNVRLEPGMVFTIEPGLYEPGVGGIRIEDMLLVTETGSLSLC